MGMASAISIAVGKGASRWPAARTAPAWGWAPGQSGPFFLCRRDALCLALADELPLRLGRIAEQLEYDVRHQDAGQVPILPGVQQGYIQHDDGNAPALLLRLRRYADIAVSFS